MGGKGTGDGGISASRKALVCRLRSIQRWVGAGFSTVDVLSDGELHAGQCLRWNILYYMHFIRIFKKQAWKMHELHKDVSGPVSGDKPPS